MGLSRQEYWSGFPCPPPGDLPDPGIKLMSHVSPALAGRFFTTVWLLSHVRLFATPWTVACQDPLSVGFSKQEYWSGLSFPSPGDLSDLGMELAFLMSPALAGGVFTTRASFEVLCESVSCSVVSDSL